MIRLTGICQDYQPVLPDEILWMRVWRARGATSTQMSLVTGRSSQAIRHHWAAHKIAPQRPSLADLERSWRELMLHRAVDLTTPPE